VREHEAAERGNGCVSVPGRGRHEAAERGSGGVGGMDGVNGVSGVEGVDVGGEWVGSC
jgi:hypothetical protein